MKGFISVLLLSLFLLSGLSAPYAADVSTVIGKVKKADGKPMARAVVKIGEEFNFTDLQGRFRFRNIAFGVYTLTISKQGNMLKKKNIEINKKRINLTETVN